MGKKRRVLARCSFDRPCVEQRQRGQQRQGHQRRGEFRDHGGTDDLDGVRAVRIGEVERGVRRVVGHDGRDGGAVEQADVGAAEQLGGEGEVDEAAGARFAGDVEAVQNSINVGKEVAGEFLVDSFVIPNVHPTIFPALACATQILELQALGIIETYSSASCITAADAAAKAADVSLIEIRCATGLAGKSFVTMTVSGWYPLFMAT